MKRLIFVILLLAQVQPCVALVYERFEQDGKMGIRDDQGHVVVPAAFDALGWSDGSFSLAGDITGYRQGSRWGLLNLRKEFITKAEYLSITAAGAAYVRVSREVSVTSIKVGCLDLKGAVVIPLVYDDVVIHDLRAIVMIKDGAQYKYGLTDLSNRMVLPVAYRQITPLGSLRYAVKNLSGKTALFSESGKWITDFDIDSLSSFRNDLAILYKGLYRGVMDRTGELRTKPIYRDVRWNDAGEVQLRKPPAWKIIDQQQRELHRAEADELEPVGVNRFRLGLNGKQGLVDSTFRTLVPAIYDYIGPVRNELFVVGDRKKYGLMRTDQSVVLPTLYDTLIREGHLLRVRRTEVGQTQWHLYDTVGVQKTKSPYDRLDAPVNGLRPALRKGYAGAIDASGTERIACVYDSLLEISNTDLAVKFKGLYGIISRDDVWKLVPQPYPVRLVSEDRYIEVQGSLQFLKDFGGQIIYFTDRSLTVHPDYLEEKSPEGLDKLVNYNGQQIETVPVQPDATAGAKESEGLILVKRDGKYGFVDSRGRLRIANRYEAAGDFHEGLAPVRLLGKWGFIDPSDQIIIQPVYNRPASFMNGLAVVARNGKEGIIDRTGGIRLELRYDSIRVHDHKSFILFQQGLRGLADSQGRILLEPRFESLVPIDGERVIVSQQGRFGLLSREGMSLFPMRYASLRYQPFTETFFAKESYDWENLDEK